VGQARLSLYWAERRRQDHGSGAIMGLVKHRTRHDPVGASMSRPCRPPHRPRPGGDRAGRPPPVHRPVRSRDNLILGALHLRRDQKRVQTLLESVYALFPVLRDYRRRRSSFLSGGEQQMVGDRPDADERSQILLLDEPRTRLPVAVDNVVKALIELRRRALHCCWSSTASMWRSVSAIVSTS